MNPSRGLDAFCLPIYEPILLINPYGQSLWKALFSHHEALQPGQYEAHCLLGYNGNLTSMNVQTYSNEGEVAKEASLDRRHRRLLRVCLLLLVVFALVGLGAYLIIPSSGGFAVKGSLSATDVSAIRRQIRHVHWRAGSAAFFHWRFSSLWNEINVAGTCPLAWIQPLDGNKAYAFYSGRTWFGNKVTVSYVLTNSAGVWSCTTVSRMEEHR